MRAITYSKYGPPNVLQFTDVARPIPRNDEVLIRVRAASANPLDWHFMRGTPHMVRIMTGLRKPKSGRLGVDVAGEVEAVGRSVTRFQVGNEVFGACKGAFAEYACASELKLARKPANVTFELAAAVPVAALTALQGLRDKGRVQPGQRVLINGASGGVGTFAVQLAKTFGADVTGVCSTRNVDLVRSIGADHVVDYSKEDFTKTDQKYDVIFDAIGNHSLSECRRALTPKGALVMVGGPDNGHWLGPLAGVLHMIVLSWFVGQRLIPFLAHLDKDDLHVMQEFLEAGKITPVIDRSYPLSEVSAAIRYLEAGHARGKVVITI